MFLLIFAYTIPISYWYMSTWTEVHKGGNKCETLNGLNIEFSHSLFLSIVSKTSESNQDLHCWTHNIHEDIALNELKVDSMHYMMLIGIHSAH